VIPDLTDLRNFADGFPHALFAELRRAGPVFWHEPTEHTPDGEGFWSVVSHAETLAVMRDAATFSSETGGSRAFGGTILPDTPVAGHMLNMMDDPRHQRIRRLVSHGFTPRMITRLEAELRRRTRARIDAALERGTCDFLVDIAAEIPLQAICILLGVPERDRHALAEWVEYTFDFRDRDAFEETDASRHAAVELARYGTELVAEKRIHPADDLLSVVIHASLPDEDPPQLTDAEIQSFFFLLFAAGADTTRNAVAGGLVALLDTPLELARLRADRTLLPTAVEEMVRWMSPAAYNRRTVTTRTELAGHTMEAGDKVVFWEASANRDELVFEEAFRFDAGRDPNPHVGFGHGPHHCLGANLARLEMRVLYDELLDRVHEVELTGPPEWTRSNKHNGVRHLPVRLK
jgi:cytochrome P450